LRVVEVEVGKDDLNSLVRSRDQRVSTDHVGGIRLRVERRHYRVRLRTRLAFTASPYQLTVTCASNSYTVQVQVKGIKVARCLVVKELDLRLDGREFDSRPPRLILDCDI